MAWLPAAIAAAGQIGGSLFGAGAARKNVSKTNRAQRELAAYSFNRQVEMWNMQNKYNSPKAQMQRLKEAGLNPHLMYGQGTVGNANQMPIYNVPQQDYRGRPSIIGSALEEFTGAAAGFLSLQQAKVQLVRDKIKGEIEAATKSATTNQIRDNAAITRYQEMIQMRNNQRDFYGIKDADTFYKIIFESIIADQSFEEKSASQQEQYIWRVLKGVAITKEVADALKSLGFGALIGNLGRSNRRRTWAH